MQYSLTYRLGGFVGDGISRTISGFAYPGETLTSTVAGQWFVDDVAVVGETGATYVVNLLDIGKPIRCDNSNALTCWKPSDIAGVIGGFFSIFNVFNSISPDVPATNNQTVRSWLGVVNGYRVEQTIGANQPLYFTDTPRINFDGSDDRLIHVATQIRDFSRNTNFASVYSAVRDTNRIGGTVTHPIVQSNTITNNVLTFGLDQNQSVGWRVSGRREVTETFKSAAAASSDGWHVVAGKHLYSSGALQLRVDGAQVASSAFDSSGSSDNRNINATRIGSDGTSSPALFFPGDMAGVVFVRHTADISATDQSRIERYLGLLVGLNIPLV
jgi:hypothetical protein